MRRESLGFLAGLLCALMLIWVLEWESSPLRAARQSTVIFKRHTPPLNALRQLCKSTSWRPGLWIQCHNGYMIGGLNNARNRVQTCLRMAIDAGAGIVLPPIALRDSQHLKNLKTDQALVCTNSFWDTSELVQRLKAACPRMPVLDCKRPQEGWPRWTSRRLEAPIRSWEQPRHTRGELRNVTDALLADAGMEDFTIEEPVIIAHEDMLFGWDYRGSNDSYELRRDMFQLMPFTPHLQRVGRQMLGLKQLQHGFVGIHFRAENDWPQQRGSREEQQRLFLAQAVAAKAAWPHLDTIFVTCGDRGAIQALREAAEEQGFVLYDKWQLLERESPSLNLTLSDLSFDHLAIIDYELMVAADIFLGVQLSTFSALIAFGRGEKRGYKHFGAVFEFDGYRPEPLAGGLRPEPRLVGTEDTMLLVTADTFPYLDFFP